MADTLAFAKDNNVWLSNADGTGLWQVTLDGTASAPYETPSQADDGTVVAIRETPGQRRQIYRMTQSGGLLNPPINTPAPGTGAIDGKVSPDGTLVAYWFVTTVSDPVCAFCVDTANQVLLSHSDRFTNADEVGTPNTGGWPSWLSNDTITLGSGSATQWWYKLGMSEAQAWFTDSDVTGDIKTLLDAEVAPSGDRMAVVRGDNQETILLLKMNGPPPAKPSVANTLCAVVAGPTGKFVDPTWSADGRTLAWQEDDGVWTMPVPADLADCGGFGQPVLRVPGAKNPDFGPAAINAGPRPACGNPGNPVACPTTTPPSGGSTDGTGGTGQTTQGSGFDLRGALTTLLGREVTALRKLGVRGLARKRKLSVAFDAPGPGTLSAKLAAAGVTLAKGQRSVTAAGHVTMTVAMTKQGLRRLRRAKRLSATLTLTFKPAGGVATSVKRSLKLKR